MKPREPFFTTDVGSISLEQLRAAVEPVQEERDRAWQTHNDFLKGPYTELQKETHTLRDENKRLRGQVSTITSMWTEACAELTALKAEIEQAPVVFGREVNGRLYTWCDEDSHPNHTHKARLVRIEEIGK